MQIEEKEPIRVLITGAHSYIGTSFEKWVSENCPRIQTDTLDLKKTDWEKTDFSGYAAVFHVAGIAHADVSKVTEEQKQLYYQVNTELTARCAEKAKTEGVKQFIFMSSMIVYGESGSMKHPRMITRETPLAPANFYGDSKVRAEEKLRKLDEDSFRVVILRPPMIYGEGSKGNYPLLAKLAGKLPFFPAVKNERSMLYVGNLCKFVSLLICREERGIFFPQNREYVCTASLVQQIAKEHGKKIALWRWLVPFVGLLEAMGGKPGGLVKKAFGNMTYEKSMSEYPEEYRVYDFAESVHLAEQCEKNGI